MAICLFRKAVLEQQARIVLLATVAPGVSIKYQPICQAIQDAIQWKAYRIPIDGTDDSETLSKASHREIELSGPAGRFEEPRRKTSTGMQVKDGESDQDNGLTIMR